MEKKEIRTFYRVADFEAFVNAPDVDVISIEIKAMENSAMFQESFFAIVFYKAAHPSPVSLDTHTAEEDFYRWWALHFFGLSVPYPDYIPLLKQFLKEATTGKPSLNRAIGSDSGDDLNRPLLTGVRKASDPHAFTTDPEVQNWLKSLDEETYLMCQAITDLCDRRHNTRLKFEVNKIVQEYASLRENEARNKAIQEAIEKIDKYWRFDNNQQHLSSWHDKQDLLENLAELKKPSL